MDVHFHGYKLKYALMNEGFLPIRASQNIKSINIFINLDDFFHKLHTTYIDEEFRATGSWAYKQMASNILNLIGHYKNWALKEGMTVSIYLIYTSYLSIFKNELLGICKGYRQYFKDINDPLLDKYHHVNSVIRDTIPLVQAIVKYVSNAYMIDTKYIEPSIVPYYLSTIRRADWNFIVSRDIYDLQYATFPNWSYVSPKGDNSKFISGNKLWEYIYDREKIINTPLLPPDVFHYAKQILGDKYRSIPKIARVGWKTIIKYLLNNKYTNDSTILYELQIQEFMKKKKIDPENYSNNGKTTSAIHQVNSLLDTDKSFIDIQLIDISDNNSLIKLSGDVFNEFPLNIPFLVRSVPNAIPQSNNYFWRR